MQNKERRKAKNRVKANCFLLNARFLIYRHTYKKSKPTEAAFIRNNNCVKIIEKRIAKKTVN